MIGGYLVIQNFLFFWIREQFFCLNIKFKFNVILVLVFGKFYLVRLFIDFFDFKEIEDLVEIVISYFFDGFVISFIVFD